jgi:dihydroorotase-like cyclic amidohydrolase
MSFDTIIRGGTVATAADTFACDIAIRDGRIVALGHDLGEAATIIDATDRPVLPGGIDSHVHFAQPSGDGIVMADGFATGTPYEGLEVTGWPVLTMLRGKVVVDDGVLVGAKGYGSYLPRTKPLARTATQP